MATRRDFLTGTATLMGASISPAVMSQTRPCPPRLLDPPTPQGACIVVGAPQYMSSMSAFQVRALTGSYAPANGTSSLRSVMPAMWSGNDDIMRPWSGGAKSVTGTRVWVHGGGHSDSSNNSIAYFDFAGTDRPAGWAMAGAGQTGVSGATAAVGSLGFPVSVHTYDGMCELNGAIYRFGGSAYPSGGFTGDAWRFDPGPATWTRLPSYPAGHFAGMVIANSTANKILAMERWATYFTYAFYRAATATWGTLRQVDAQYPSDAVAAYNSRTNTAFYTSDGIGFVSVVDWSTETITQTRINVPSIAAGTSAVYDSVADRYWLWGGEGNSRTLYGVHPSTFAVTSHTLSGDAPLAFESGDRGAFGRFVFMEDWRAIGSVASRTAPPYIIRLP